jgi:hypothetical protein
MVTGIARLVGRVLRVVVVTPLGGASVAHPYEQNGVPQELLTTGLTTTLNQISTKPRSGSTARYSR